MPTDQAPTVEQLQTEIRKLKSTNTNLEIALLRQRISGDFNRDRLTITTYDALRAVKPGEFSLDDPQSLLSLASHIARALANLGEENQ